MTETEEVTVDKKDITYDILIDESEERPDRGGPDAAGGPAKEMGDHPVVTAIDLAVKHSEGYLKKQNLPPANADVYKDFSRPFLNEAAWHYLPDGGLPDDPRFALALGVGGLALAFAPTLLALYERKEEEKKREEQEKKRKRIRSEENGDGEEEEKQEKRTPVPGPVAEPPDWMTRLESGMLGGM
ncbi:hypothetical protein [Methanoculleus sp.]|uniref:hypothetical protein n=1 Tax=Methanoculleus sp. TaxID=90427 RepID=UPI0025F614D7|nr:hypothetical protein [Methanoculleus sp.]